MDLIERLFDISPDGGDGSLEALFVGVFAAAILAIWSAIASLNQNVLSRRPGT